MCSDSFYNFMIEAFFLFQMSTGLVIQCSLAGCACSLACWLLMM